MSKRSLRFVAGGLGILVVAGLWAVHHVAGTWHNAFNIAYWRERRAGFDLYIPAEHYLKRGRRDRRELLLTFDDGPHANSCGLILSTLEKERVPATFFVVGKRVKQRPDLVKRMVADGFEVGNHTQDHLRLDTLTPTQIANEIRDCDLNVQRAGGVRTRLLRPPGMRLTPDVLAQIGQLGYTVIGWNVGAKDFIPDQQITGMSAEESAHMQTTPDEIVERVMKQIKSGEIILLHDNPVTAQALPTIIQQCKAQGYVFRTCTEFLEELPHPVEVVANPKCVLTAAAPRASAKPAHA
jgi:peptidoglycan-N-acetylmuramic acid deacetylase